MILSCIYERSPPMARPAPVSTIRYPLNAILGAESNVRLLRELCLHGGYISATQLAERTGLVRNSTRNALNSLRQYGLVVEEGTDRSRLFRFNSEHPLGDSIGQLFGAESGGFKISSKGPSKKSAAKRLSGTAPNRQRFLEGCEKQQRRGGSWQHRQSVQCLQSLIAPSHSPTSSPPSKSARPTKTITRRWRSCFGRL